MHVLTTMTLQLNHILSSEVDQLADSFFKHHFISFYCIFLGTIPKIVLTAPFHFVMDSSNIYVSSSNKHWRVKQKLT